jgi:uncharacterized protein (DUF1919 family)
VNIPGFLAQINRDNLDARIKYGVIDRFFSSFQRAKLKNKDFSILGNNCFVGGMYHKFGLPYNTPTIWTYIYPEDYLRFLGNLEWYLKQPLKFKTETNHIMAHRYCKITKFNYPIGVLGDDVEVHFMHYRSQSDALNKWNRRTQRLNLNNLFIVFSDGSEFKEGMVERYEKLPFKHKIFLSSKPRDSACTVFVKDYADVTHVYDSTFNRKYEKYIDLIKWLNCEDNYLTAK